MRNVSEESDTLIEIGKRLRGQGDDIAHEPLPERWVDLILYLDEQARKQSERPAAEAEPSMRRTAWKV